MSCHKQDIHDKLVSVVINCMSNRCLYFLSVVVFWGGSLNKNQMTSK